MLLPTEKFGFDVENINLTQQFLFVHFIAEMKTILNQFWRTETRSKTCKKTDKLRWNFKMDKLENNLTMFWRCQKRVKQLKFVWNVNQMEQRTDWEKKRNKFDSEEWEKVKYWWEIGRWKAKQKGKNKSSTSREQEKSIQTMVTSMKWNQQNFLLHTSFFNNRRWWRRRQDCEKNGKKIAGKTTFAALFVEATNSGIFV